LAVRAPELTRIPELSWLSAIGLGRRHDGGTEADAEQDEDEPLYEDELESSAPATTRRPPPVDDSDLKPTAMRGNELMYGYLIAAELILVAILNLSVIHGKGAPAHPSRAVEIVGLVASIGLLGVLQVRHRIIVPFAMIVVAYLVVYPKTPDSLTLAHLIGLVAPVIYAILLMQRQRKATLARTRSATASGRASRPTPEERRSEALQRRQERRDRRRGITPAAGPQRSSRYTPPKPRRPKP
jgi:hypothetical protein